MADGRDGAGGWSLRAGRPDDREGVVVIWEREDHVDSTAIAERFGFGRVDTLPEFYATRTDCPDCGGDCTCPAALYVRDLED